jgi:hypothetical protein
VPRPIDEPAPARPAYFWWLLANALALCFAVVSWAVCLHVFGHPEVPRNYRILAKLGRLPELKRYTVLDVPNGIALAPRELYQKFFGIRDEHLAKLNSLLMRNYLANFDRPLMLTYIEGDYQVERTRPLAADDFLVSGFVVRARAMVKPDDFTQPAPYPVVIEYVFPTRESRAEGFFGTGDILTVKKSPNCAAVIHVGRILEDDEPALCLTVIPIAYGPYHIAEAGSFGIEPPEEIRPGAELPMFRD